MLILLISNSLNLYAELAPGSLLLTDVYGHSQQTFTIFQTKQNQTKHSCDKNKVKGWSLKWEGEILSKDSSIEWILFSINPVGEDSRYTWDWLT